MRARNPGKGLLLTCWLATLSTLSGQEFSIPDVLTDPAASTVNVTIQLTHDEAIEAFQIALSFDSTILEFDSADVAGLDIERLLLPWTVEVLFFTDEPIGPSTGWAASFAIFDFVSPFAGQELPPGPEQSILRCRFNVLDPTGCTPVNFEDGVGDPPVFNTITESGMTIFPDLNPGQICFGSTGFRRGDVDGDGDVNGLVDGLYLLNFGFVPGSPSPPCVDAADADDDGILGPLIDSVFVLTFQFIPGSPPPPPPGPDTCAPDPTPDALDCQVTCTSP